MTHYTSGFPFRFLVNLLVDVLRERDVRQFSAITFSAVRGAEKGRHSGRFDGAMESPSLADGKTPSAGTRYVLYISF
jgi:hypothetical protein